MKVKRKCLIWTFIWLWGIYFFSYFIFLKPCEYINKCPISKKDILQPHFSYPDVYLLYTLTCVSEDEKINEFAYYVYWPLNKLIELKGHWYFVKNPQKEKN